MEKVFWTVEKQSEANPQMRTPAQTANDSHPSDLEDFCQKENKRCGSALCSVRINTVRDGFREILSAAPQLFPMLGAYW